MPCHSCSSMSIAVTGAGSRTHFPVWRPHCTEGDQHGLAGDDVLNCPADMNLLRLVHRAASISGKVDGRRNCPRPLTPTAMSSCLKGRMKQPVLPEVKR